ncbi:hypothetical protein [Streptomyces sp. NPDC088915]|uniref:hypothetical protein n=1 Tax=Streptomyces sp. NPDC088915 TaxID=3365912 RepID=UPI003819D76D
MSGMRLRPLNGSVPAGTRLLLSVLEHGAALPEGVWLSDAAGRRLMDKESAVWSVEADGTVVQRTVFLLCTCSCVEVTTYQDGSETSRIVGPIR